MLLSITHTTPPATDLGYLVGKNPSRTQSFTLSFGKAHVFWPEATAERATLALLLEIDPVGLVRGPRGRSLEQYVNDRPYVASSFTSVAISDVLGTGLSGRSRDRPELASQALPLEARLSVVPCRGGEVFLRSLLEPLGYHVDAAEIPLDAHHPEWGRSRYLTVALRGELRLSELLAHLYVLLPVLDDQKHYFVGDDEVAKLVRFGEGWLSAHPERDAIAERYLKHRHSLVREALERIVGDEGPDPTETDEASAAAEQQIEGPIRLADQRMAAVVDSLRDAGAKRVLDLGCGEGQLLRALLADKAFEEIVGVDVSLVALEKAERRLHLDRLPERQKGRIRLLHGSVVYRDARLAGYDAAAVIEVIEHLEPHRLEAFEQALFAHARPSTVVVTTPNAEHNVRFASLPAGRFRHGDHRFEWTRAELRAWADAVANRHGYTASYVPIGPDDPEVGPPTQAAVFRR